MRIKRSVFFLALIFQAVMPVLAQSFKPEALPIPDTHKLSVKPPFTLEIRLQQKRVSVGEPILIDLTMESKSKEWQVVSFSPYWLHFIVRDSEDRVPLTRRGRLFFGIEKPKRGEDYLKLPGGSQHADMLLPGRSITLQGIALPDFYDLSKPGKYTIRVESGDGSPADASGEFSVVRSNAVTVEVVP